MNSLGTYVFVGLVLIAGIALALSPSSSAVGYMIIGAVIGIFSSVVVEDYKQNIERRNVAAAIYHELANRVARCVYDFESPWERWLDAASLSHGEVDVLRLRKFTPVAPVVYPATAAKISLLGDVAPQSIIRFYVFLSIFQKDMESTADFYQKQEHLQIPREQIALLAEKLRRTLAPGLQALIDLSEIVSGFEKIEAASITEFDYLIKHERSTLTLRQRLDHYAPKT